MAAILAACAGFTIAKATAFYLSVSERGQSILDDSTEVFEVEPGGLGRLECLKVPCGGGGIPAWVFLILVIPSADGILVVEDPLNGVLCDFFEVGDVISEGLAKGVAFAESIGGDGVFVAPEAFGIVEKAAIVF